MQVKANVIFSRAGLYEAPQSIKVVNVDNSNSLHGDTVSMADKMRGDRYITEQINYNGPVGGIDQ